jgi:hypothetical protein
MTDRCTKGHSLKLISSRSTVFGTLTHSTGGGIGRVSLRPDGEITSDCARARYKQLFASSSISFGNASMNASAMGVGVALAHFIMSILTPRGT